MTTVVSQTRSARLFRRGLLAAIVVVQTYCVLHAYVGPQRYFGFQMFSEASMWQVDIDRVTRDGRRVSAYEPFFGYSWFELAPRQKGLRYIDHWFVTTAGIRSSTAFLQNCLDWVADHTPRDTETDHYEAVVHYTRNRRPEATKLLRSKRRVL